MVALDRDGWARARKVRAARAVNASIMECKFSVGQRVALKYDLSMEWEQNAQLLPYINQLPKIGVTYTIRDIYLDPQTKVPALHLNEITNGVLPHINMEVGFAAALFKPITDISIFTEMLKRTSMPKELENAQ
jgi:hypothetical protein